MTREHFEALVEEAFRAIPREFRRRLKNVAIVVETEPSAALLAEMDVEPPGTLFGLYQGTPLTQRTWDYGNRLPDRIVLFQGPITEGAADEDEVFDTIAETLIHEAGHYFGMSEEQIEAIEEQYWRGDPRRRGSRAGAPGPIVTVRKRFGQHFLEPAWVAKVIDAIAPAPDEAFLEIGPGPRGPDPTARRAVPANHRDRDRSRSCARAPLSRASERRGCDGRRADCRSGAVAAVTG